MHLAWTTRLAYVAALITVPVPHSKVAATIIIVLALFSSQGLWIYALDVTHPEALAYIRTCVGKATREWGFKYLKLDFLHTAAMPGGVRHDASVGRAEALHRMMSAVRSEVGEDVFVLACGAPIGPCIGLVDAMRVSADAATHWLPTGVDVPGTKWMFAHDRTNLPAARNMVRNVAVRLPMSGRLWRNDPDCLILRESADFTLGQAQALSTIAVLSAGALIFSDPPESLAADRLAVLQVLLPPLPRAGVAVDLLRSEIPTQLVAPLTAADACGGEGAAPVGEWWLVALFNWHAKAATAGGDGSSGGLLVASLLVASAAAASGRTQPRTEQSSSSSSATASISSASARALSSAAGWHLFEFWSGTYQQVRVPTGVEAVLRPPRVPPRCGCLFALRPVLQAGGAQLVGTSMHVSCGQEAAMWKVGGDGRVLEMQFNVGRAVSAPRVWVYLPGSAEGKPPKAPTATDVAWVSDGVWLIALSPIGMEGLSSVCRVKY